MIYTYVRDLGGGRKKAGVLLAGSRFAAQRTAGEEALVEPLWTQQKSATWRKGLEILLRQGYHVYESLLLLQTSGEFRKEHAEITHLVDAMREGSLFSEALRSRTDEEPFVCSFIEVAEGVGALEDALACVDRLERRKRQVRQKLVSALSYPLMLMVAGLAMLIFLGSVVLPTFVDFFSSYGAAMPAISRWAMAFSGVVAAYAPTFALLGGVAWVAIKLTYLYSPKLRFLRDRRRLLRSPFAGLRRAYFQEVFFEKLGLLYRFHGNFDTALEKIADVEGNLFARETLRSILKELRQGRSFSQAVGDSALFSAFSKSMFETVQRGGTLTGVAEHIAAYYAGYLDRRLDRLTRYAGPVSILVIGAVVGFLALSVMIPLFELTSTV